MSTAKKLKQDPVGEMIADDFPEEDNVVTWVETFGYNKHGVCVKGERRAVLLKYKRCFLEITTAMTKNGWGSGMRYGINATSTGAGGGSFGIFLRDKFQDEREAILIRLKEAKEYFKKVRSSESKQLEKEANEFYKFILDKISIIEGTTKPGDFIVVRDLSPVRKPIAPATGKNAGDVGKEIEQLLQKRKAGKQTADTVHGINKDAFKPWVDGFLKIVSDQYNSGKQSHQHNYWQNRYRKYVKDKVQTWEPAYRVRINLWPAIYKEYVAPLLSSKKAAAAKKTSPGGPLKKYPGGQNGSGVYQSIINIMPPHLEYFELCAGSGAVFKNKLPAEKNVINDIDPAVAKQWEGWRASEMRGKTKEQQQMHLEVINQDAIKYLIEWPQKFKNPRALLYLDPPFLKETRRSADKIYRFEFMEKVDHERLLHHAKRLECMVVIACYDSELYREELKNWNKVNVKVQTHQGQDIQTIYFNYEPPEQLHDYRYLGSDYREREDIKRQIQRWQKRFENMPPTLRNAIISKINKQW